MENKRDVTRPTKTGKREILGIESRQWRDIAREKEGWGGYPSSKRKVLNLLGFLVFAAIWIYLFIALCSD